MPGLYPALQHPELCSACACVRQFSGGEMDWSLFDAEVVWRKARSALHKMDDRSYLCHLRHQS